MNHDRGVAAGEVGADPGVAAMSDVDPRFLTTVDFELTNRCNADCYFCPRDETPHEGLMSWETFEKGLERTVELRGQLHSMGKPGARISICGLGEPLINKHTLPAVERSIAEGFLTGLTSNGSLLDPARGDRLLEAGLDEIHINVGERDEGYEEIYKLPWVRTRDNVERFVRDAEGICDVYIVLVDHRRDPEHLAEIETFWRDRGARKFVKYAVINRGGALFVDHQQYAGSSHHAEAWRILSRPETSSICITPFMSVFIGYDGNYYLCCSDWKKELSLGSVYDRSILGLAEDKLAAVESREPVCKTCNLDPVNLMIDSLRARDEDEISEADCEELGLAMGRTSAVMRDAIHDMPVALRRPPGQRRRTLPVTSI